MVPFARIEAPLKKVVPRCARLGTNPRPPPKKGKKLEYEDYYSRSVRDERRLQ